MAKRAFTLVEVIIAILLLNLVVYALYQNLNIVKKSTINLREQLQISQKETKSNKLLYLDLLQADGNISIISRDRNYDRVCFYSKNSIYNLPKAYICWAVHKKNNTLLRVESAKKFTLPPSVDTPLQKDIIKEKIEIFRVHKHRKQNQFLVYIKGKKEISFRVKGMNGVVK